MRGHDRRAILAIALLALAPEARSEEDMIDDLHDAAAHDDVERLRALLAAGAPVDGRDRARRTPLLTACRANAVAAAQALIAAGADVNAKDNIRDTPFLYAGAEGRLEILRLILATGRANLKDTNRYGGTALIPAAHHGHPDTVALLLKTDIAVDHVNRLGWTALLETIILSDGGPVHQNILAQLIAAGANVNLADGEGASPLAHAKSRGYAAMVALLERAGAR